jgi:hypothetical protein
MAGDRMQGSMQPICKAYARAPDHPCMGFCLLPHGLQGAMQGMQGSRVPYARARGRQIHVPLEIKGSFLPCMPCIAPAKP